MSRSPHLLSLVAVLSMACGSPSEPLDGGRPDGGLPVDGGAPDAAPARCVFARCVDGVATTCDGAVSLDCTAFGGACVEAVTEDGDLASWCGCGAIPEGGGRCGAPPVECVGGLAYPATCPAGTVCDDAAGLACYCDDLADGVCPDAACVDDPDCGACVPDCTGRACGDNGCGGDCGGCGLGARCEAGACVSTCVPSCTGRECGADGCGGSCGDCTGASVCDTALARCVETCVPSCEGRAQCEPDGCGGDCGPACEDGLTCVATSLLGSECACPLESMREVTVDGTAMNWGPVLAVVVELRPTVRRPFERTTNLSLTSSQETRSGAIWACDATTEMEARVTYYISAAGGGAIPCPRAWQTVPLGTLSLEPLAEPVSCGAPAP